MLPTDRLDASYTPQGPNPGLAEPRQVTSLLTRPCPASDSRAAREAGVQP